MIKNIKGLIKPLVILFSAFALIFIANASFAADNSSFWVLPAKGKILQENTSVNVLHQMFGP